MIQSIGRYQVIDYLGQGGMAKVYKCTLTGLGGFDKKVVVKRVLPDLVSEPEFIQMFLEEARLVANLTHPNVVQVFEIDQDEGVPFIAMEYIHGPTLLQLIRQAEKTKGIDTSCIIHIVKMVADGLHYVHTFKDENGENLGIVHRDATPQNILVAKNGNPKIIDFGIAKCRGRLNQTQVGVLKGKVGYVTPEQIRGTNVDARTDVFALGVTLFRATTGRMPFEGRTQHDRLSSVLQGRYRTPSEIVSDFPPELEQIILKAIQGDPDQRFASTAELSSALVECLGDDEPGAPKISAWIKEIFPNDEWTTSRKTSSGATSASNSQNNKTENSGFSSFSGAMYQYPTHTGASTSMSMHSFVQPKPNRFKTILITILAMLGIAGAAVVANFAIIQNQNAGRDQELIAYLNEVERYIEKEDFKVASELLSKAEDIQTNNAQLNIRRVQLMARVEETNEGSQDQQLLVYLDEIDRLSKEGKFRTALQLLEEVKKLEISDPKLSIERANVIDEVERRSIYNSALKQYKAGKLDNAKELAKLVLDQQPEHKGALSLLKKIVEQTSPPTSEEPTRKSRRRRVSKPTGPGFLNVNSTPDGMVYLDDIPIGKTPINTYKLTSGRHTVEVRRTGYENLVTVLTIDRNRTESINAKLKELPKAKIVPKKPLAKVTENKKPTTTPTPVATSNPAVDTRIKKVKNIPKSRLPRHYTIKSMGDLNNATMIMKLEIAGKLGQDGKTIETILAKLVNTIRDEISSGKSPKIYPRDTYYFVADSLKKGQSVSSVSNAVVRRYKSKAAAK